MVNAFAFWQGASRENATKVCTEGYVFLSIV
jgi:hypothetical protein